jgi:hypothetical protein
VALSAAAYFAYEYTIETARPGVMSSLGWFGYYDQSQYLLMAHDLSHFRLSTGHFLYGVGYPIVAVPFLWLGLSYDPWLVFDALAFVFAAVSTFIIASRLFGRAAGAVAGFGLVFATPLVSYCVIPWNSTVSLVALGGVLVLGTSSRPARWHPYGVGALVAWAFAARYVDVLWLAPIGAAALSRSLARPQWRRVAVAAATALLLALPVLALQWSLLNSPFRTPYELHLGLGAGSSTSDQNLHAYSLSRVPRSAFGMFVSPYLLGAKQPGTPLFSDMFWTLAAVPGIALGLLSGRFRLLLIVLTAGWIAATVFYLSFRATGAAGVKYDLLHYFKMWWPVASIFAAGALVWVARLGNQTGAAKLVE